jgi:hypothetical protein
MVQSKRLVGWIWPFYMLPWRISNSYGVFTPTVPTTLRDGRRRVALLEGSLDGTNWTPVRWKFACGGSDPRFIAPYHPRVDHQSYYEQHIYRYWDLFLWDPYTPRQNTWLQRLGYRLMQGRGPINQLVESPFAETAPPKWMRVRRFVYHFSTSSPDSYYHLQHDGAAESSEVVAPYSFPANGDPFEIPKPELLWFASDRKFDPWCDLFDTSTPKVPESYQALPPSLPTKLKKML